jgi:DNA-3-methyladenine glycosylase
LVKSARHWDLVSDMKLTTEFYNRHDVVSLARELIGCIIYTKVEHQVCAAVIAETEAYAGIADKASHAYGGRFTNRTSVMYNSGGVAYVYLCYGIHKLFNIVTANKGIPHAILIRGAIPLLNEVAMKKRFGMNVQHLLTINGPGKFSKAMGIELLHNGISLTEDEIWVEKSDFEIDEKIIKCTPRIGVDYAAEDAMLPYRFLIRNYWKKIKRPIPE